MIAPGQAEIPGTTEGQRAIGDNRVGQGDCTGGIERGAVCGSHDARAQCTGIADHDAAGVQRDSAGESAVGAAEQQVARAFLGQFAAAGDGAAQAQVVAAADGQVTVEGNLVGEDGRGAAVEHRNTSNGQGADAQGGVAAHHQAAGIEHDTALEGVGATQAQGAVAVLGQAAGAGDQAAETEVGTAADAEVTGQVDLVGHGDGGAGVQHGAAGSIQHTGAEGDVAAQEQGAGVEVGQPGVAAGVAAQGQGAGAVLVQATGAADVAGQGQGVVTGHVQLADHAHSIADRHGAGGVEGCASGSAQGTGAEGAGVAQQQGARAKRGTATVGIDSVEGQGAAAGFFEAAGAIDHATEGQGIAADRQGQDGIQMDLVGQCQRHGTRQGRCATNGDIAVADGAGIGQGQDAAEQRGVAIGVDAGQGQVGPADLDQGAAADQAAQGQVGGTADVHGAIEVDGITQVDRRVSVQGAAGCGNQGALPQRVGVADDQATGIELGIPGVGVVAVQDQVGSAVLDQAGARGATDHPVDAQGGGAADGQVGTEVDAVGDGHRSVGIQRGVGSGDQQVVGIAQCSAGADDQGAGVEQGVADDGVGPAQCQARRAVLGQDAGAGDLAIQRQVVAAGDGQVAPQVDRIGGKDARSIAVQDRVGACSQAADTQRGVAADDQLAVGQGHDPGVVAVATQGQVAGSAFDQQAGATERTAEGGGRGIGQRQGANARVDGVADGEAIGQQAGVGGHGQLAGAQRGVVGQHQGAAAEGRVAGEVVGAAEGQGVGTGLAQAAGTRDFSRQGQVAAACEGQVSVELDQIGQGLGAGVFQRAGAGDTRSDGARAGGTGIGQDQLAGVDVEAAAEVVETTKRQVGATRFGQRAGAIDRTAQVQGRGTVDGQVGAVDVDGIGEGHRRGSGQGTGPTHRQLIGAGTQGRGVAQGQGTGGQGSATGQEVDTVEGQGAGTRLDQSTGAAQDTVEGQAQVTGRRQVARQGDVAADRRVGATGVAQGATVGRERGGAEQCIGVDPQQAAVQVDARAGGAGLEQLVGQRPGATADHQVVEVDVLGTVETAGTSGAGTATDGIHQVQGVAVVDGTAVDDTGRHVGDAQAAEYAEVHAHPCPAADHGPGNGIEGVGAGARPQVDTARYRTDVGEDVAQGGRLHRHTPCDVRPQIVGQHVPGATP